MLINNFYGQLPIFLGIEEVQGIFGLVGVEICGWGLIISVFDNFWICDGEKFIHSPMLDKI